MKSLVVLAAVLLAPGLLHAQLPPAVPIEMTSESAPPWAADLYAWTGAWQAPQALYDRGDHQDDPAAWSQESNDEGSTWNNTLPGVSHGILVVDLGEVRSINRFAVFQMMGSDGKTTGLSVFRNSSFLGDLAPGSSGLGWKPVVSQHPIAEGVLDSDVVSSPTTIDVATFETRYLMLHAWNDGSLGDEGYIELKGVKAFLDDSINVLRGGPTFILAIDPPEAGTTDPAPGRYAFTPGEPLDIEVLADEDASFESWQLVGSGSVDDEGAEVTSVTLDENGGKVTARLDVDRITRGSTRTATAAEASLDEFTAKPKVSATFVDPFTGKTRKAIARVLTKPTANEPADEVVFEWRKRVRLYDPKALRAMEEIGQSAADYVSTWQSLVVLHLSVAGKDVPDGVQSLPMRGVQAPVIEGVDEIEIGELPALLLTGTAFGTSKPKVWREVLVNVAPGLDEIRRQPMKVVPLGAEEASLLDSKGKPTYMDAESGESEVQVLVPAEPADGELTGVIVIDSGVGLGTAEL